MRTKQKKPLAWSRPATPEVADAIKRLIEIKSERAKLAEEFARVQKTIIAGNGGCAHGFRAAIRHTYASVTWRKVTAKEREYVTLLKATEQ